MARLLGSSPLSVSLEANDILVLLDVESDSLEQAEVTFAGLAPGFAGLYQVNFTIPTGLGNGDAAIFFGTIEAFNQMASISVSGSNQPTPQVAGNRRIDALRSRAHLAHSRHSQHTKNLRRALPERSPDRSKE